MTVKRMVMTVQRAYALTIAGAYPGKGYLLVSEQRQDR